MSAAATVADLQRALLAIAKGGRAFNTWAEVNGMPLNERASLRRSIEKDARVLDLRRQIHALDPNAALYFGHWGGAEAQAEFRAVVARTAAKAAAGSLA